MANIEVKLADITTAEVDVIVNAANPELMGGWGVDGAIHKAAGKKLLEACQKIPSVDGVRCPVGQARITPAGNLAAKFVIHAVGPIFASDEKPQAHLASAYINALKLAQENNCSSIAFPAISCGAYGFPPEQACQIAIESCSNTKYRHLEITFYLIQPELYTLWQNTLNEV